MKIKSIALIFVKLILGIILAMILYQVIFWHNLTTKDYVLAIIKILLFSIIFVKLVNIDLIIKKIGSKNINLILNTGIGILLFLYFYIPIINHLFYRESGLDMGIYDQAIWKYAHFLGYSNTIDGFWGLKNVLGDHFEIILMIISPIYWIYSNVIILHLFNGLVIAAGCFLLYKLAKLKLNNNEILAKISVMIFLLFTGLQMAMMEGQFHPLIYVPILIIAIVYFIEIEKWWPYWISIAILLSIKESMGLYLVFIGLYLIVIDRKYWRVALMTAGLGIAHYLITVREVAVLYGGKYRYFNYTRLGKNNIDIIKTIITKPIYTIKVFFTPHGKIETLALILGSFGTLVLSAPLVIAIPMFAERFFSDDEHIWLFYMHYNAPLAGALICAMVFCLSGIYFTKKQNIVKKYIPKYFSVYALITFVLISTILININYRSDIFRFFYHIKQNVWIDQDSRDLNDALRVIPAYWTITAQNAVVTHISEREEAYELPVVKNAPYIIATSGKDHWPMSDEEFKNDLVKALSDGYGILYYKNHTIVLQYGYHGALNVIPETFFK